MGSGPFPTELEDENGQRLRDVGKEYGSTTGRPRRTGWLDIPALNYACRINGVTKLLMMKADVLSGFETLHVATEYVFKGEKIDYLPYDVLSGNISPVYTQLPGWNHDLTGMKALADLPQELEEYTRFIAEKTGIHVAVISVGPDREQTLLRKNIIA